MNIYVNCHKRTLTCNEHLCQLPQKDINIRWVFMLTAPRGYQHKMGIYVDCPKRILTCNGYLCRLPQEDINIKWVFMSIAS